MKKQNGNVALVLVIILLLIVIAAVVVIVFFPNVIEDTFGIQLKPISSTPVGPVNELADMNIVDATNTANSNTVSNTTGGSSTVDLQASNFGTNFLKLEPTGKNLIYSPLSIQYALYMLKEGAAGNTRTQIDTVLGNSKLTTYTNIDKVLSLANGLFIRETYRSNVLDSYKDTLLNSYKADVVYDPFANANNFNNWVNDKTMGIIPKLLEDIDVQREDVKMIIANALAIDMEWKVKFDSDNTHEREFNLDDGGKMKVPQMSKTSTDDAVSYYQGDNVTVLALDLKEYEGNQFQFLAIMPDSELNKYAQDFQYSKLSTIVNGLKPASGEKDGVSYSIPRFSYEYNLALKSDLMQMGLTDAFIPSAANFEKITGNTELYVGDALHKARIDFTEKGVKAAAVTAFIMRANGMFVEEEPHPVVITIDKPFLYVIRDKKTGEVWFIGTVYEPMKWADYQKERDEASNNEFPF